MIPLWEVMILCICTLLVLWLSARDAYKEKMSRKELEKVKQLLKNVLNKEKIENGNSGNSESNN